MSCSLLDEVTKSCLSDRKSASATVFHADTLDDWLLPEGKPAKGVLTVRTQQWKLQPEVIDHASSGGGFGSDGEKKVTVAIEGSNGRDKLDENLQAAADAILAGVDLPQDVREQIQIDVCSIGAVVGKMCPFAQKLLVKLEIMGENSCRRWHQDSYVGRAIVTYNSSGTEYTADDNVDFGELENCGNNAHIIRNTKLIQQAAVGDVLFMKGKLFPGISTGLVHKSPEKEYQVDGKIVKRLLLKIDVPAECAPAADNIVEGIKAAM